MKYFHLVWSALMRRRARSILTMSSILAAFMLFGLLEAVNAAFTDASQKTPTELVTVSKFSPALPLPEDLKSAIAHVKGIRGVAYLSMFDGVYIDELHAFPVFAISNNYLTVTNKYSLPPAQMRAFGATRDGAIVGIDLARRYGWRIGQRIPLIAPDWPRKDGSTTWTFELVGIFHAKGRGMSNQENSMLFHWDYYDAASFLGDGTVNWFVEPLVNPKQADQIAHTVDAISANSDHETRTGSASEIGMQFANQIGDVGLIVTVIMIAVFFTLILLTGNAMTQAVRERIPELAILKTLGFTNRSVLLLVLAESVLLVLIGGLIGMALAELIINGLRYKVGASIPVANLGWGTLDSAVALMVLIGLVVGILPALRGMRLRIVDALAER